MRRNRDSRTLRLRVISYLDRMGSRVGSKLNVVTGHLEFLSIVIMTGSLTD